MKVTGRVWTFAQDDINTDQIRPKMYAHLPLKEQAKHCLETLDPGFGGNARAGDIIVAGKNFGAGSSTPAWAALLDLGIAAVVAESFARVFFRSSISGGLVVTACPGILELASNGDTIELDTIASSVRNLTTNRTLPCVELPAVLRDMIEVGGEKAYLKARIAAAAR
jgi:3-isopropylmalate/(R)-2-methylmalate dehydratase small subunit